MNRILIVGEDEVTLGGLGDFFRALGFALDTACQLPEALELLYRVRYDLVVADLRLSYQGSEGLQVMQEVRERWPGTRTILLADLRTPDLEAEARRRGVDCVLEKPVSLPELETIASGLLGLVYRRPQV